LFNVTIKRAALKEIKKESKETKKRIFDKLKGLENPFSMPYEKLKGEDNIYRVRIGDFRAVYYVDMPMKEVVVLRIRRRGKAYKGL
jgi:mRNA interferase RelE/StbE